MAPQNFLTSILRLTDEELSQIRSKAKLLRRVCQPFLDFETIISAGLVAQAGNEGLIETGTKDYMDTL